MYVNDAVWQLLNIGIELKGNIGVVGMGLQVWVFTSEMFMGLQV